MTIERMNAIRYQLDELAAFHQQAVLDALTSIYGLEQGLIDYVGYYYSGNYSMTIEHVEQFINDEFNLQQAEWEEEQ